MVTHSVADNKNTAHIIVLDLVISLTPPTVNNKANSEQRTVHFSGTLSVPAIGLMCLWAKPLCWGVTMLPQGAIGESCVANEMIVSCGKPVALPLAHLSH